AKSKGVVTSECLKGPCWFGVGCEKCLPKDCPCNFVGHYCGLYVWVLPGGQDELAKLTLTMLDYALSTPPQPITKAVVYYIDAMGLPTTLDKAVGTVSANVGITERNEGLLNLPHAAEVELRDQLQRQLAKLQEEIDKYTAEGKADQTINR